MSDKLLQIHLSDRVLEDAFEDCFNFYRDDAKPSALILKLPSINGCVVNILPPRDAAFWAFRSFPVLNRNIDTQTIALMDAFSRATFAELRKFGIRVKSELAGVFAGLGFASDPRFCPRTRTARFYRRIESHLISLDSLDLLLSYYEILLGVLDSSAFIGIRDVVSLYELSNKKGAYLSPEVAMFFEPLSTDLHQRVLQYDSILEEMDRWFDSDNADLTLRGIHPGIGASGRCSMTVPFVDLDNGKLERRAKEAVARRVDFICKLKYPNFYCKAYYYLADLLPPAHSKLEGYLNGCTAHALCASDPLASSPFYLSAMEAAIKASLAWGTRIQP